MRRKAIFLLYRVVLAIASPLVLLYLLWRGRKYWPTVAERFGGLPSNWQQTALSLHQTPSGAIWLHAVSVGEVLAAVPLVTELKKRSQDAPIFLSTSTLAGRETAEKRLGAQVAGIFYAPLDYVWMIRRVLRRIRPTTVVVLETEIWPNLFREAKRLGCGLVIVNGRISDRALPGYRKWNGVFASVLGLCDRILTQSGEMRDRYVTAGAPPEIVSVGGNLKYDFVPAALDPESPALQFVTASPGRPVWIAASTSADDSVEEEDFVLAAQRSLPGWRLILAPRKPDRFEAVAGKLAGSGLRWTRRTAMLDPGADVLLLDSIGELSALFAVGKVVFMGGTLAERGGHNILEPAVFGKPVIAGPHLENFRDIEAHFEKRQALIRIASGAELAGAMVGAAGDPAIGERARAAAAEETGATARAAEVVMELCDSRVPVFRPAQPGFAFLWFLAQGWRIASARDRRKKLARARRLAIPVVSVGNITAGGTSKTPMVIELLREFAGIRPGLLTRGHGRSTKDTVILLPGCEIPAVSRTGDEARLCAEATGAAVGIGADRFSVGEALIAAAAPGVIFLDDGFQHLQLERDFNLILIDALNPFGGGELLPLGRLREPLEGLARADALVITRANQVSNTRAIESVLRRFNPHAPIFRAGTKPLGWKGDGTFAGQKAVAFCGLGNPESFWKSLTELGISPLGRFPYDDHHRYTPAELRRLAVHAGELGATVLLTTAKDAVNLPPDYRATIAPLELFYLEIGMDIDDRAGLVGLIRSAAAADLIGKR